MLNRRFGVLSLTANLRSNISYTAPVQIHQLTPASLALQHRKHHYTFVLKPESFATFSHLTLRPYDYLYKNAFDDRVSEWGETVSRADTGKIVVIIYHAYL